MHPLKLLPTTLLLSASVAVATHSESSHSHGRQHSELAQRLSSGESESELEKRATYSNVPVTWYPNDTGPDACTGKNHQDSDWYVALYSPQFGDGSACCGKKMRITANGKTTVATCVDSCPSCTAWGALDMTKGLFQYFDTLGDGEFTASWSYTSDDDDDGDDSPPPPPKKTTTTTHHSSTHTTIHTTTHTTTSTTHSTTTTHSSSSSHSSSHSASATHSSASATPSPSPTAPAGPDSEVIKNFTDSMLGLAALVLQAPGAQ